MVTPTKKSRKTSDSLGDYRRKRDPGRTPEPFGGDESSEFHRQNALIAERWRAAFAGDVAMPGTHHFSVVDGLADHASPLFAATRRLMKLDK